MVGVGPLAEPRHVGGVGAVGKVGDGFELPVRPGSADLAGADGDRQAGAAGGGGIVGETDGGSGPVGDGFEVNAADLEPVAGA